MATDMTTSGGREPAVDMLHQRTCWGRHVVQNAYKAGKAQIRHLAALECLHTLQSERLRPDDIVFWHSSRANAQ